MCTQPLPQKQVRSETRPADSLHKDESGRQKRPRKLACKGVRRQISAQPGLCNVPKLLTDQQVRRAPTFLPRLLALPTPRYSTKQLQRTSLPAADAFFLFDKTSKVWPGKFQRHIVFNICSPETSLHRIRHQAAALCRIQK